MGALSANSIKIIEAHNHTGRLRQGCEDALPLSKQAKAQFFSLAIKILMKGIGKLTL